MTSGPSIRDIPLADVFHPRPELPDSFERAVIPIDKARGLTSFDVIRKLRRLLHVRKMGHAGTLDPLATGLLIVLVGRATKLANRFTEMPKEYAGTMRLGETTPTYDSEGAVTRRCDASHVTQDDLARVRAGFEGSIRQQTPPYSAVKVEGERLYKKARRGESIRPPYRFVTVHSFELTDRDGNDVSFSIRCSMGTYVRSLAHDFGRELGVGAHLTELRRTAIGPYSVDQAWTIEKLADALS